VSNLLTTYATSIIGADQAPACVMVMFRTTCGVPFVVLMMMVALRAAAAVFAEVAVNVTIALPVPEV